MVGTVAPTMCAHVRRFCPEITTTIHTLVLLGNVNIFPEQLCEYTSQLRIQKFLLLWILADTWVVGCVQFLFSVVYSLYRSSLLSLM